MLAAKLRGASSIGEAADQQHRYRVAEIPVAAADMQLVTVWDRSGMRPPGYDADLLERDCRLTCG